MENNHFLRPVVLCIGTVNVSGDSLGPKVGDMLVRDYNVDAYVYGTTDRPVNGINYDLYVNHIKLHHAGSVVIAVDACLGELRDVGRIKYTLRGLKAGAALNKQLTPFGDFGILGVVGVKGLDNMAELVNVPESAVESVAKRTAKKVSSLVCDLRLYYENIANVNSEKLACIPY